MIRFFSARIVVCAAACLAMVCLAGCETNKVRHDEVTLIPVNSLAKVWSLPLDLAQREDSIRAMYLRDDTLIVYSRRNLVVAINAKSGMPLWAKPVTPDEVPLRPPVVVKEQIAVPGGSTITLFDKKGDIVNTISTKRSIRSGGTSLGNTIYIGQDYPEGGRLAAIDLTRRYDVARWELMTRAAVSAAPAIYQNIVFFASEDGRVYAVSEDRGPAWPLEHSAFQTDGRILADVKADDGGVYVASTDSKLYCLESGSGRVRWQYYASVPLTEAPVLTPNTVYLYVPNLGIVAIDKVQGKLHRDPKWIVNGATQFLSFDDKYVYLRGAKNHILGVDRQTGEVKFESQRADFVTFATNNSGSTIYASTRDGTVMAIKPVITPGTVGTLVLVPQQLIPMDELVFACAIAPR